MTQSTLPEQTSSPPNKELSEDISTQSNHPKDPKTQSVILFYKYGNLSSNVDMMEPYRKAYISLCSQLHLKGRILIGLSDTSEGINGTLAGDYLQVMAFTYALHGEQWFHSQKVEPKLSSNMLEIIQQFWKANQEFANKAKVPIFTIDSPEDFKWSFPSLSDTTKPLFPDLNIKLVSEIISTGGKLSNISVQDTSVGYLTPEEWHDSMQHLFSSSNSDNQQKEKTTKEPILIDCRNQKEYAIGHFQSSINPKTKTFEQFPTWVHQNKEYLKDRPIYMYCTGGIRCEKASAHVRNALYDKNQISGNDNQVYHLKGGIHKYLEKYGSNGMFQGKNFVFDRRGADDPAAVNTITSTQKEKKLKNEASFQIGTQPESNRLENTKSTIVGKCRYCDMPWDTFTPDGICTVCREPTLICDTCRNTSIKPKGEYHCEDHAYLQTCYFTNLTVFTSKELIKQKKELQGLFDKIAIGKKFKQKRKTLQKQLDKLQARLKWIEDGWEDDKQNSIDENFVCRSCGEQNCKGSCWGFHGLARKRKMQETNNDSNINKSTPLDLTLTTPPTKKQRSRPSASQRKSKQSKKETDVAEINRLGLSLPPSSYRDPITSLRCPKPCTRILQTQVKGKWCGKRLSQVLQTEFASITREKDGLMKLYQKELIRVNDKPIQISNTPLPFVNSDTHSTNVEDSDNIVDPYLKNMDVIGRVLHWHEPPVLVPATISVQKVSLPKSIRTHFFKDEDNIADDKEFFIYCCDKPSTVPTHPTGPYLSNSLTLMVEAQESLPPRSLLPCHRLDRVTSGLTLCCTSPKIARLLQAQMTIGNVSKIYLAKVKGKFPNTKSEYESIHILSKQDSDTKAGNVNYIEKAQFVEVNAAIDTIDPGNGIRAVSTKGKQSKSQFKFISYDDNSDTSLIACYPITGRGHQLRVHLQWIGYPIYNDVQYGGSSKLGDNGNESDDNHWKDIVVNCMMDSCKDHRDSCDSYQIRLKDEKNAREVCQCCQGKDGILSSFTSAQLLQDGHEIALHALRYSIKFEKKPHKQKVKQNGECMNEANPEEVMEMKFQTKVPDWADPIATAQWMKSLDLLSNMQ